MIKKLAWSHNENNGEFIGCKSVLYPIKKAFSEGLEWHTFSQSCWGLTVPLSLFDQFKKANLRCMPHFILESVEEVSRKWQGSDMERNKDCPPTQHHYSWLWCWLLVLAILCRISHVCVSKCWKNNNYFPWIREGGGYPLAENFVKIIFLDPFPNLLT